MRCSKIRCCALCVLVLCVYAEKTKRMTMTKLEIIDDLHGWTNEDLENRASICITIDGNLVTWLNRGYKEKLVKALIAVLSEELDLREEIEQALKYIDAVDAKQLDNDQDDDEAETK